MKRGQTLEIYLYTYIYIFLAGFADSLKIGCERRKQVKGDSEVFGPEQLEGVDIY